MSAENSKWLNSNILVGYDTRPWWLNEYEQAQNAESSLYSGPVPVEDVKRRLFNFEMGMKSIAYLNDQGEYVPVDGLAIPVRSDNGDAIKKVFTDGYTGHGYTEWLLDGPATLISDDLGIGSAGLLRNGAQAWVQLQMPGSITTPEGVEFRPHLLATTSFDGTIATTYKRTVTVVVCDNTRECALNEAGQQYKVKHSKYSALRLTDAREALAIVHTISDDFAQEVAALTAVTVTDKQFDKFLDEIAKLPEDEGRGYTVAEKKRDALTHLYRADERAASWTGTAYGVLQAVNTYNQHETQVRGEAHRAERVMENLLSGTIAKTDTSALDSLAKVLRVKTLLPTV